MKDDVRTYIYGTLIVFVIGVAIWLAFLFVSACGFTLTCKQAAFPVERTPVPTLLPATLPVMGGAAASAQCRVAAVDLIGAWVSAGSSQTDAFQFIDVNGQNCESTFDEVQRLFVEANLWSGGSYSCVECHSADLTLSAAQLDLGSYEGIMAGSRRADATSKGTDILGDGNWKSSLLYQFLSSGHADVPGHASAVSGLMVFAGKPLPAAAVATPSVAETPTPIP